MFHLCFLYGFVCVRRLVMPLYLAPNIQGCMEN